MNAFYYFFIIIITIKSIYGQETSIEECIPVNTLLGKDQSNNCCVEEGITCVDGHITKIYLNSKLDINVNKNRGFVIPPELGNLSQLESLNLGSNALTGSIPPELGKLVNLKELILNHNKLNCPIPPELGNLFNLEKLYLDDNKLYGSIPPELGKLLNLKELYLDSNTLSGECPSELGNLTELRLLSFYSNKSLKGYIPIEIAKLSNLTELNVYSTGLVVDNEFCMTASNTIKREVSCSGSRNTSKRLRKYLIIGAFIILQIICVIMLCCKRKNKDLMKEKAFSRAYRIITTLTVIVDICALLYLAIYLMMAYSFSHSD